MTCTVYCVLSMTLIDTAKRWTPWSLLDKANFLTLAHSSALFDYDIPLCWPWAFPYYNTSCFPMLNIIWTSFRSFLALGCIIRLTCTCALIPTPARALILPLSICYLRIPALNLKLHLQLRLHLNRNPGCGRLLPHQLWPRRHPSPGHNHYPSPGHNHYPSPSPNPITDYIISLITSSPSTTSSNLYY